MLKKLLVVILLIFTNTVTCFAFEKIKAVTYFGNEWPINFLNSEHFEAVEEFKKIKKDGFNTVIYVVPWREIQPDINGDFDDDIIFRLRLMMYKAEYSGLNVMFRLGYTWDLANDSDVLERYEKIFTDNNYKKAWLKYAEKIYEIAKLHNNFIGAYITWEDFWDGLIKTQKNFEDMDKKLTTLLSLTQEVFPNLSMECRLHVDNDNGTPYFHEDTFSCGNALYSSALLTVSMGHDNDKKLETKEALSMSEKFIDRMLFNGKPLFVDQFLYMETTPGYENLAMAKDTNAYLAGMGDIFNKKTIGYGIWTYRDYVDNIIYNPEFGMDDKGWDFDLYSKVLNIDGNNMAVMDKGAKISQKLTGRGFISDNNTKVRMKVIAKEAGELVIQIGNRTRRVDLKAGEQIVNVEFDDNSTDDLSISTNVNIFLDNVKVYSHITSGKLYDMDGNEQEFIKGIRILNSKLGK